MKFIKEHIKIVNIVLIIIFLIMLGLVINNIYKTNTKYKEYTKQLFYMDTYIKVTIYSDKDASSELKKIDKLYKDYNELADKYNVVDKNLNYINNTSDEVTIDSRLAKLIKYGISLYDKSNGLFNINIGCVTDIWKSYRELSNGVPSYDELNKCNTDISNIKLTGNKISGDFNIDLGGIAKGYVTELAGQTIKDDGYKYYMINAGGNVVVSTKSDGSNYKIGIQSPSDSSSLLGVVQLSNEAVATSGGYERYYEYDGQLYHHIIDTKTLYPANYMKSVSVITKSSTLADSLSTILFLMPIEEGKKYAKNYDCDVIWVDNDNNIITKDINLSE